MGQILFIELLIILYLPLGGTIRPEQASAGRQAPSCRDCHSELLEHEVLHYPAEDACDNCHEATGASHPSEDSLGFRLMDRVPDLCHYCHDGPVLQGFPHHPYANGECMACHDAHGSSGPSLLRLPDPELCLGCHRRDIRTDTTETVNIRRLVTGRNQAHSAIELGGCMSCHLSHGSDFRALLVESYPEEDYLPGLTENFALCFLCHDTDLMDAEQTDRATGFRNGTRNLHWTHMNGSKGRNCRMCHNIHGSPLPFLVEEGIQFGQWEMHMNYVADEQGGSCLPGCHGSLSYRR